MYRGHVQPAQCNITAVLDVHLVKPAARLRLARGDAGPQVSAGPVAVGQAPQSPLPLQRGQAQLNRPAQLQHSFGQRVTAAQQGTQ